MDAGVRFSRLVHCLLVGGRRPGDLVISKVLAVDGTAVIDDAGVDLAGCGRSTRPAIWRYIVNSFVGRAKMRQDAEGSSNPWVKIMQLHMTLTAPDRNAGMMRLRSWQRRFGAACPR